MNIAWLITTIVLSISAITVLSRIADAIGLIAISWVKYLNTVMPETTTEGNKDGA